MRSRPLASIHGTMSPTSLCHEQTRALHREQPPAVRADPTPSQALTHQSPTFLLTTGFRLTSFQLSASGSLCSLWRGLAPLASRPPSLTVLTSQTCHHIHILGLRCCIRHISNTVPSTHRCRFIRSRPPTRSMLIG